MPRSTRKVRALSKNRSLVRQQRLAIIRAAYKVFAQKGYNRATLREIAALAGMTAPNIYRYVGSKEDILHLLCRTTFDTTESMSKAFEKSINPDDSVAEALRKAITGYLIISDQWADTYLFYDRNTHNLSEEDRALIMDTWLDTVAFFERLLRRGIRKGEFKVKYPALVAHNIASLSHYWAARKRYLGKRYTVKEFASKEIEILLGSLQALPETGKTAP